MLNMNCIWVTYLNLLPLYTFRYNFGNSVLLGNTVSLDTAVDILKAAARPLERNDKIQKQEIVENVALDPLGIPTISNVPPPQPKKAPAGMKVFGSGKKRVSATFGMSEMADFIPSSAAGMKEGERSSSDAMSFLLDRPTDTFSPTKVFCTSVADRLDSLITTFLGNSLGTAQDTGDAASAEDGLRSQMASRQLKSIVEVLKGQMTLAKFDEAYKKKT